MALAMAVFAELPVAVACAMIAFRASSEAERAHRAQALMHRVFRRRGTGARRGDRRGRPPTSGARRGDRRGVHEASRTSDCLPGR